MNKLKKNKNPHKPKNGTGKLKESLKEKKRENNRIIREIMLKTKNGIFFSKYNCKNSVALI